MKNKWSLKNVNPLVIRVDGDGPVPDITHAEAHKIADSLTALNMKYNYPDIFAKSATPKEASERMRRVYGESWITHKEDVEFWYENDFYRDDEGNVVI